MKEIIAKLLELQKLDNNIASLEQLMIDESDSLTQIREEYGSFFSRYNIIKEGLQIKIKP